MLKRIVSTLSLLAIVLVPFASMARADGPQPTVYGIASNMHYNENVRPFYSSNDGSGVSATLNGRAFTSGTWVSDEGTYGLTVTAHNGSNPINRNFTIDKTAPTVNINNVSQGQTYNNSVHPTFSASDNIRLQNVSATLDGYAFLSGTIVADEGTHGLTVTAMDAAGNTTTINRSFTIDYVTQNGQDGKDGKDGKDGADGKDGTNGTNGTNGTDGTTTIINRYFRATSAYAKSNEVSTEQPATDDSSLTDIRLVSFENSDGAGGDLNSCRNVRIIGRAKEGLMIILYLKHDGSDMPVIGFVKAAPGDTFEFVTDKPLAEGNYQIYAKAAKVGGQTGPLLLLGSFEVEKCSKISAWLWALILLILVIIGAIITWLWLRKKKDEDEDIGQEADSITTESRL